MIINSPVGRFPFQVKRLSFRDGRLRMDGSMGAWPTSVEIAPVELPGVVWQLLGPGGVAVFVVPAGLSVLWAFSRRESRGGAR